MKANNFNVIMACYTRNKNMLWQFVDSGKTPLLRAVANNQNAPAEVLTKLADGGGFKIKNRLICNPCCPPEVLGRIIREEKGPALHRVNIQQALRHPNCPKKTLRQVSKGTDYFAKMAIIGNPNCPPDVLRRLSNSKEENLVKLAVKHKNCPPDVIEQYVESSIKKDEDLFYVAENPSCPQNILRELALRDNEHLKSYVFANENCPVDVLVNYESYQCDKLVRDVAGNKSTPPGVLLDLSEKHTKDTGVLYRILTNPNCPVSILEGFLKDKREGVRSWVAANENCPARLLRKLSGEDDSSIRAKVARHENTPLDILVEFSKCPDVIDYIAENRKTPKEVLENIVIFSKEKEKTTGINSECLQALALPTLFSDYGLREVNDGKCLYFTD